jgi:hypothetical protein
MEAPLDDPDFRPLYITDLPRVTCNDGSGYKAYVSVSQYYSSKWVIFMQGGAWCFDAYSCGERWATSPQLMSSKNYTATVGFGPSILSGNSSFNPNFYKFNFAFLPYCTSDDFTGNAAAGSSGNPTQWSFMGSKVLAAAASALGVVDNAVTTIVLAGSSAGGEGVLPNVDRLASLYPQSTVLGLVDSGWFLDSAPYYAHTCKDAGSCTEQDGLKRGVPLWNSVMDDDCAAAKGGPGSSTLWQCLLGPYSAPYIKTRTLFLNWAFDIAQMGHDGIGVNPSKGSAPILAYAQQSAHNLTASFQANPAHTYTSSACYCHTVAFNPSGWPGLQVGGARLPDIVKGFLRNPAEAARFFDTCNTPGCNPTCPPCH